MDRCNPDVRLSVLQSDLGEDMRHTTLALCVSVALALVVPVVVDAQTSGTPTWREYRPAGGRYRVEMPGTPVVKTDDIPTEDGRTVPQIQAIVEDNDTVYAVAHTDYPPELTRGMSPEEIFRSLRQGITQKRRLRRDSPLIISGAPAREFIVVDRDGRAFIIRGVWWENRIFQIMIARNESASSLDARPETRRFFDSFSLVKP